MQHDSLSEEVTPVSDPARSKVSSASHHKPWKPARLTIHSSLKSTPVSLRSRSPFTPIILNSRTTSCRIPDAHLVKRKLFSIASTPRKKNTLARKSASALLQPRHFRISGGKQRTQPIEVGSARKTQRFQGGVLTSRINRCVASAALNLRVFRTALGAAPVDLKELTAMVRKSLVLRVIRKEGDLLIARSWSENDSKESYDDDLAVVVPQDSLLEDEFVDFSHLVLFVPEPWSIVTLSTSIPSRSGILVIPYKLGLIQLKAMSIITENCTLNSELGTWQRVGGACDSEYEVPDTEDPEAENEKTYTNAGQGESVAHTHSRFSTISPHAAKVSVWVVVDLVLRDFGMAIIQDVLGERAVYQTGSQHLRAIAERQQLNDVEIRPRRMEVETLIRLLSSHAPGAVEVEAALNHLRRLPDSCTMLVFTKRNST